MTVRPGVCEECGQPSRQGVETATGRAVCQSCADTITASAAAILTGATGLSADAGEALAIRGWVGRIRQWRQQGRKTGRPDEGRETQTHP